MYDQAAADPEPSFRCLGAMGCGAYRCPPQLVAEEMRSISLDPEFKGWFCDVVFAVYTVPGGVNFEIFEKVFEDVEVGSGPSPIRRSSAQSGLRAFLFNKFSYPLSPFHAHA